MIEFTNQHFMLSDRLLKCRTRLGDKCFEEVYLTTGDAQLDIEFINRMIENGKRKIVGLEDLYDDELLQNARVRYEKFKPFSRPLTEDPIHFSSFRYNTATRTKDVIFNDPATIVFWNDGTKTVVKAENEPFDREKGLAMAISKKFLGNKGNYFETFKKFIKEGE